MREWAPGMPAPCPSRKPTSRSSRKRSNNTASKSPLKEAQNGRRLGRRAQHRAGPIRNVLKVVRVGDLAANTGLNIDGYTI